MREDDEEEELLQRALAEQAAREVSYQRPSNHPPPNVSTAASGPPRREPPRTAKQVLPSSTRGGPPRREAPQTEMNGPPRREPPRANGAPAAAPPRRVAPVVKSIPIDEDDESDVELLSLSSDDEDEDQSQGRPAMVVGNQQSKSQGAVMDEDDELWDENDEEPQNWGGVNQSELARRVREMRETRTAPTAYAPATRLRKSTNIVDVPARAEDFVDPLGLGVIDIRSLTLIPKDKVGGQLSAADKGSDRGRGLLKGKKDGTKAGRDEADEDNDQPELPIVKDHATREKVIYHSEKFDSKFFLARIHQNTSAYDLEAAGDALKRDLQSRKEQLKKLVKENFDCFISCKNTIDDIHSKLQQIESAKEGTGTVHLNNAIAEVDVVAKRAFAPLLERQAQVERIRSVQGMLQRFRTLFNLPSMIRANISKGEYDLAIREYKKAKSLVLYSHVGILSRVLEEVDKIVQEFKEMLYKKMEDPHIEIAQLENTIRLLLELEPDSDPVWHYLTIQDRRIRGLLEGCTLEHDARMDALHGRVRERVQSDARWKQLQRESNKASDVDFNLLLGSNDKEHDRGSLKESTGNESDALLGRLIRRLTAVIVTHLPSFWRLAISIFNGKFAKVTGGSMRMRKSGSVLNNESGQYPLEEVAESKFTSHSLDEVVTMVHCIISLYESKVQTAFFALAEANVLRPYMREGVAEISKACIALEEKDCAPASAFQMLLILRTEVTRVFVLRLCALMHSATTELVNEEDWIPVATVERGGSPFTISSIPLRFRDMLESAMEHLIEMLDRLKRESPEHEDMVNQRHQMQDNVHYTFFECFLTLAENLEKLAFELSRTPQPDESAETNIDQEQPGPERFMGLIAGNEVTSPHQRFLMVLSNAGFCNLHLLPELSRKYQHVWSYAGMEETKGIGPGGSHVTAEEAAASLSSLEDKILNQYNYAKATSVGTAAAAYLLDDGTQWSASPPVKGIRDAVVELLHPLVSVHAEVYAGAKPFVEKVINHLAEGLMEALLNVFTENKTKVLKSLDVQGYCQLMLEVEYIEAVLGGYLTPPAREAAHNLRDLLLDRVLETVGDMSEPGLRRSTRSSDDGTEDRGSIVSISQEDIQILLQQVIADYLPHELKRTRVNVFCFTDALLNSDLHGRRAIATQQRTRSIGVPGALKTRHRRKNSASSLTDSESGKPASALPPLSPYGGYASSEVGSDGGIADLRSRGSNNATDRYPRGQSDLRRTTQRPASRIFHDS